MKYIKKPIVIDAIQFDGSIKSYDEIEKVYGKVVSGQCSGGINSLVIEIKTLEGLMTARAGDYIIKGVAGEIYPCKPDIFEKTYEEVLP